MIRLRISRGAEWIDLGQGVRALVEPMTTATFMAMRNDPRFADLVAEGDGADAYALMMMTAVCAGERLITEWEGVGDEDGKPVAPGPETIDALFAQTACGLAFFERVIAPWQQVVAEKNGSAPSLNGTSVEGETIAASAPGAAPTASTH